MLFFFLYDKPLINTHFAQAQQSLPQEPSEQETGTSKIRVRKPTGDFLERRFFINNNLQVGATKPHLNCLLTVLCLTRICSTL